MAITGNARPAVAAERRSEPRRPTRENWTRWYVRRALSGDFLVAFLAGYVAFVGRFGLSLWPSEMAYLWASASLPFAWVGLAALHGAYDPRFLGVGSEEFHRVLRTGVTFIAAVAIVSYASKAEVARGYVVLALPLAIVADVGGRYLLRKHLHRLRQRGRCMRRAVVVGHQPAVGELVDQLRREHYHGMEVVGTCLPRSSDASDPDHDPDRGPDDTLLDAGGVPVLGDFSEVPMAVETAEADTVAVLACVEMNGTALRRLAWQLEKSGTELIVAPGLTEVAGPRTTIRPIAGLPLLHVDHPELAGGRRVLKNLFDRVTACLSLALLAPVLVATALAVRATTSGPALFRQTRIGREGREFTLLKFRTMCTDAEARRPDLLDDNEHEGVLFKIRSDPRVTPLGARLRRYSLDELPQLVNVARGHMSLVGPRPPLPQEVEEYGHDVRRRLVVRPGLTGLWQISGRSDLSWEESVRLDLRYVENWSLTFDLVILWKTVGAVLRASGAY